MEVREKDVLVCRKIWSMKDGFTVVVPLKVANCRSALEESSLELREERLLTCAQSERAAVDLLKSPMRRTARPANLSAVAHFSAVWRTYSFGRKELLIRARYLERRCHMVCGPEDFGGTITWIIDKEEL